MAARQFEEIQRLKTEALSGNLPDPTVPEENHQELTPDPWQLHPVRVKKSAAKKSAKKAAKKTRPIKAKKVAKTSKAAKRSPKPKKKTASKKVARRSKR